MTAKNVTTTAADRTEAPTREAVLKAIRQCPECSQLRDAELAARVRTVLREVAQQRRQPLRTLPDSAWPDGHRPTETYKGDHHG